MGIRTLVSLAIGALTLGLVSAGAQELPSGGSAQGTWTPPACEGIFTDVPCTSQFAAWIEQFSRDGITSGCATGLYCPDTAVTRRQMAVFVERAMRGSAAWMPFTMKVFAVRKGDGTPDPAASGQALLDAFSSLPSAGPDTPWLIDVGPGVFDLGSEGIWLHSYCRLRGAGQDSTIIRSSSSSEVLRVASHTTVEGLTVESAGAADAGDTIYAYHAAPVVLRDVTVRSNGASYAEAIVIEHSEVLLERCNVAANGPAQNVGVKTFGDTSLTTLRDVVIAVGPGTSYQTGINHANGSPLTLERVRIVVDGSLSGTIATSAVSIQNSPATITELIASVTGGPSNTRGIMCQSATEPRTIDIHRSTINAISATIYTSAQFTVRVGASQLAGGPVNPAGGTITCLGVYDENYASAGTAVCP
jgi:hypothetical protein